MTAVGLCFETPVSYAEGLHIQETIHALRLNDEIPDTLLFLEHKPVVTLGNRGRTSALISSPELLTERGIDFHQASRGGDATYHAPGQLVMYPILRLGTHEADAHGYLYNLEQMAIDACAAFDVEAWRREGMNGAWTPQGKISAIGFRIKRWVTMHGLSFNVNLDLAGFSNIIPCGLQGEPVARLVDQAEGSPTVEDVRQVFFDLSEKILQRPLKRVDYQPGIGLDQIIR